MIEGVSNTGREKHLTQISFQQGPVKKENKVSHYCYTVNKKSVELVDSRNIVSTFLVAILRFLFLSLGHQSSTCLDSPCLTRSTFVVLAQAENWYYDKIITLISNFQCGKAYKPVLLYKAYLVSNSFISVSCLWVATIFCGTVYIFTMQNMKRKQEERKFWCYW